MSSIDVLLADDNVADARLAIEAMDLSTLSATIHVVGTGQEAIAFLKREEPHPQAPRPCVVLCSTGGCRSRMDKMCYGSSGLILHSNFCPWWSSRGPIREWMRGPRMKLARIVISVSRMTSRNISLWSKRLSRFGVGVSSPRQTNWR
jgi:hypothetical protein